MCSPVVFWSGNTARYLRQEIDPAASREIPNNYNKNNLIRLALIMLF